MMQGARKGERRLGSSRGDLLDGIHVLVESMLIAHARQGPLHRTPTATRRLPAESRTEGQHLEAGRDVCGEGC